MVESPVSLYHVNGDVCKPIWKMTLYKRSTKLVCCGSSDSCVVLYARTEPHKTLSVRQCLGRRSERRPTVMKGLVRPVFILTLV